jgi:general secretion pathway protein L
MDLRTFLRWWFDQLTDLVPRGRRSSARNAVVLSPEGGGVVVAVRRERTTTAIAQLARGKKARLPRRSELPSAVIIQPRPEQVLRKDVTLPATAARHLKRLLTFELERETPFAAEEVFWSFAIKRRSPDGAHLDVEIAMVPRDTLAPVIAIAKEAALPPVAVEIPFEGRVAELVALGNATVLSTRDPWLPRLAVAAAALAMIAAIVPWIAQERALSAIETRIATAQADAIQAAGLRRQIDQIAGRSDFFVTERSRSVGALEALAAVTSALPDDSYLHSLTLRGNRLTLRGYAARSADLIPRLAQSPLFRDPAFQSPVVRGDEDSSESFLIGVELAAAEQGQ